MNNNFTTLLLSLVNASSFNYTYYRYIYRAISNITTLTFAFRQDPSFWCLDDISVIQYNTSNIRNTSNLIGNGDFEKGALVNYSLCTPSDRNPTGSVYSGCAHAGNYSYYDGSYAPGDYLSQTFATIPQQQYQISFWLQNMGSAPNFINVTVIANVMSSQSTTTQQPRISSEKTFWK
ncbi:unnamed protein product, partial [Rotaria sordida]